MNLKSWVRDRLQTAVRRVGYEFTPARDRFDWPRSAIRPAGAGTLKTLQPAEMQYLRASNPRLLELRKAYADCGAAATEPVVWTDAFTGCINLSSFRGDNGYIWQCRLANEISYAFARA